MKHYLMIENELTGKTTMFRTDTDYTDILTKKCFVDEVLKACEIGNIKVYIISKKI